MLGRDASITLVYRPVVLAPVAVAAAVSTAHAHPSGPGPDAGGPGALALVLLSLAVVAGRTLVGARPRVGPVAHRLAATAAAAVVAVVLTIAAPHLVHHTLDADQGASCSVLQIVGSTDAAAGTAWPVVVSAVTDAAEASPATSVAAAPLAAARVRAPPA